MSKQKSNKLDDLSTEELERALRERYLGKSKSKSKIKEVSSIGSKYSASSSLANNIFGVIIIIAIIAVLYFVFTGINKSSYSGSSSKTDWEAYCRDMFPDNDSYSRAAREGCVNGGETTDNLIEGKYNK